MKPNNTGLLIGVVVLVMLAIFGIVQIVNWCKPAPATQLVVKDGVQYEMLSMRLVICNNRPCYLITFAYPDELKAVASGKIKSELRRGTIIVPKQQLWFDNAMTRGRIIWDQEVNYEGKAYKTARCHPRYIVPAEGTPVLREEKPLTRSSDS